MYKKLKGVFFGKGVFLLLIPGFLGWAFFLPANEKGLVQGKNERGIFLYNPYLEDMGLIRSGEVRTGSIYSSGDADSYHFYGNSGEGVYILMGVINGNLYPSISLYDPDGILLESAWGYYSATIDYQLQKSGLYTIICRDYRGIYTGDYGVSFTKMPPNLPPGLYNPTPGNGAITSSTYALLDWSDTQGATKYDLYFGTNVDTPLYKIAENITQSSYTITSSLTPGTTYYWQVIAKDNSENVIATGPVWMFTASYTCRIGAFLSGRWYIDLNGNGLWDGTPADVIYNFGSSGYTPISGDWNGDGTVEIGVVFDGKNWFLDYNGNGVWDGTTIDKSYVFGASGVGFIPVTGDWDGDGK